MVLGIKVKGRVDIWGKGEATGIFSPEGSICQGTMHVVVHKSSSRSAFIHLYDYFVKCSHLFILSFCVVPLFFLFK